MIEHPFYISNIVIVIIQTIDSGTILILKRLMILLFFLKQLALRKFFYKNPIMMAGTIFNASET